MLALTQAKALQESLEVWLNFSRAQHHAIRSSRLDSAARVIGFL
jgi:hypothetical protein